MRPETRYGRSSAYLLLAALFLGSVVILVTDPLSWSESANIAFLMLLTTASFLRLVYPTHSVPVEWQRATSAVSRGEARVAHVHTTIGVVLWPTVQLVALFHLIAIINDERTLAAGVAAGWGVAGLYFSGVCGGILLFGGTATKRSMLQEGGDGATPRI